MFWRLRVLFFYFMASLLTIFVVVGSSIPMQFYNFKYHTKYKIATIFSYAFIWLAKVICGLNYEIKGLEKLPKEPSIVLANHQSFWDNVIMQLVIPEHSWIIKRELFNIPFFGAGLKMMEPIAVDRSNNLSVKQILEQGQKKIREGLWIIIFPESTRLRPEQTAKFKPSAAKLGSMAQVPLVLMAHNAGVFWPKGFWIRRPGTIKVNIVDVIPVEELNQHDVRDITLKAENIINAEKQRMLEEYQENAGKRRPKIFRGKFLRQGGLSRLKKLKK